MPLFHCRQHTVRIRHAVLNNRRHFALDRHQRPCEQYLVYLLRALPDSYGNANTDDFAIHFSIADASSPSVSLTAPLEGNTVNGNSVALSATASDSIAVFSVQFKVDGTNVGSTLSSAPYATTWDSTGVSDGSHTIYAVALNSSGKYATSSVSVTVDNTPPVISSISSGTPGQSTATVTWSTNEPAMSEVVYGSTSSYGSATSTSGLASFHSIHFTNLTAATTYHYAVVSADAQGNTSTSSDQTFTTAHPPDTTPPAVSLTVPSSGASVSGSSVTLTATASDNVGVANVQFEVDGININSAITASPYTTMWNSTGVSDGSHTLYAVAEDTSGNYATSSISLTVDNTAPAISSISAGVPDATIATTTWTTNEPGTSQVDYGPTTAYGFITTLDPTLVTSHSVIFNNLTASTTYHYVVVSTDSIGNTATSGDQTFLTAQQLAVTPTALYSVEHFGNYNGPAIRVARSSDGAQQDIGFTANQVLNIAAATSFAGSSTLTVSKWYDQSGNGYDATQTATTSSPIFDLATGQVNGFQSVTFDGQNAGTITNRQLNLPSALALSTKNSSMFFAGRQGLSDNFSAFASITGTGTLSSNPFTTVASSAIVTVALPSHGLTVGSGVIFSGASTFNNVTLNGTYTVASIIDSNDFTVTAGTTANASGTGGGSDVVYQDDLLQWKVFAGLALKGSAANQTMPTYPPVNPAVFGVVANSSNIIHYNAERSQSRAATTATSTGAGGIIGDTITGTDRGSMQALAFVFYNSALSSGQVSTLQTELTGIWNIKTNFTDTVAMDGDSNMQGTQTTLMQNETTQIYSMLKRPVRLFNLGIYGATLKSAAANPGSRLTPLSGWSQTNKVYLIEFGNNELHRRKYRRSSGGLFADDGRFLDRHGLLHRGAYSYTV